MGATQWSRQYQYDAAGQLVGIADNRHGQLSYRYDPVGRLLEAATPKGVESFRFDPAGNLLDNAPAADGHQDDSLLGNLLSQYAGRHYRYDSRGNLVEKRVNGSLTKLEWDSHNRLSRLIAPDGQRTDYHYDPLGRRIAKISQGQATLYGWDGDVLAFETRDEAAVHYLFEPDSFVPLAQVHTDAIRGVKVPAWSQHHPYDPDKDPLRQAGPEPQAPKAVYYYHTDHLGTPQALTDEHGALALEMDYQAWGQAREVIADAASKAGIRNPFRFQGQYHDDESGLHYNRYRYYDPEIGRFISRDPIGLMGGINIHSYAPNPTEWIDPIGLSKKKTNAKTNAVSCQCEQNDPCGSPTKVDWTAHGGKHVPSKNASWKDTVKSTKTGAAKYKPDVNIQALERSVWATGTPVSTGGKNTSWKVASMPDVIGASEGKETSLMRVECSQGVIHGHPISQTE